MSIVKSIRIQNFKSLEDVKIELSQLTLLFGANSSGKSSFLKALMFLSKNLFPLQYPKSKYQIGKDIDLESLEKIVTNGDVNKNLEYEFELSGSVCFPERRIIFDRLPQFEGRYDFFRRLESLQNKNVGGGSESHNFEVVYTIVFSNFLYEVDPESKEIITEKDKCICRVIIFDKISQMKYEFVLGNLTDSGDIEDYETYYHIQKPYIKDVFASKIGFVKKRKDYSKYSHFVNQRKSLFTGIDLDDIHSDEFNRSGNGEMLSSEWESLSHEDRVENFIEFMKFFYLTVRVIPTALEQFLSVIHMPTTRESVKRFYELHNDTIDENEYYGFLPSLLRYSQENLSQGIMSYCKRNEDFQKKLDQDFIRIIREADKNHECIVDVNGIKMRVVSGFLFNDLCLLVNYWLLKFDFDLYFSIYKDSKICEFYLTDCKELQISFKQASSGLIQLFPIIVSCCILLRNLEKFDKHWKQETNVVIEFPFEGYRSKPIPVEPLFFTLFMEQPELHLHPKLQSDLAIMISRTIMLIHEIGTMIIETHSEHFIRKLQVLIAKRELAREKVGVWHFGKDEGKTVVKKMEIDENGLFKKDWPDGFFDDSIDLTMELFEALRKRKN